MGKSQLNPIRWRRTQALIIQKPDPDGGSQASSELDVPLSDPHVQFVDVNGDALIDLLDTRDQGEFFNLIGLILGNLPEPRYRLAMNMGGGVFKTSSPVATNPGINLSATSSENAVTLADMNGDGMADLLQIRRDAITKTFVYKNRLDPSVPGSSDGFSSLPDVELITRPELSFSAPNVRLMDVNSDKKTDLLVTTADGITGFSYDEQSGWTDMGQQDWSQGVGGEGVQRDYSFSRQDGDLPERQNQLVHLADMNGDRLLDLVQILVVSPNQVEVRYHPLIGPARWGSEVFMEFALPDGSPSGAVGRFFLQGIQPDPFDPQNGWGSIQLMDVNGDGLTDLVYVEQNHLAQVFLNCGGKAISGPYEFGGIPVYEPFDASDPTILRTLDINGNGTTDLVFFNSAGGEERRGMRYFDFLGGQKAGLLQTIDNGIGSRTFIRYRSSTEDLIRARQSGHPWLTSTPNSTWVVSGIVTDVGLDLNGDGETDKYASSFDYRDGYYDSFEKQFRGFSYAQKVEWGDDVDQASGLPAGLGRVGAPTAVTRYRFMTGSPDGADNDEYIPSQDAAATHLVDESSEQAGREEKALKGKPVWEEVVDGAALNDESATFDLCAERTARAAHSPAPFGPPATRCTPDKYVYYRTASRWVIRRLYRPLGADAPKGRLLIDEPDTVAVSGKSVSLAVLLGIQTETVEANQLLRERFSIPTAPVATQDMIVTSKEFDYDNYGNTILTKDNGVVAGRDVQPDDERVTRKEYILTRGAEGTISRWMIRFPLKERNEDENGVFASEMQFCYDGPGFVGLPLGQVGGRGLVTRIRKRVKDAAATMVPFELEPNTSEALAAIKVPGNPSPDAAEWVDAERKAYDQYGNPILFMDPLGKLDADGSPIAKAGHFRSVMYDPVFHTYPIEERLRVGGLLEDLVVKAEYERPQSGSKPGIPLGLDVVSRSFDFNSNATDYTYDSFGRLTAVRKPGDTNALPTEAFAYKLADPHRGLFYDYDRGGALIPAGRPVIAPVHNAASSVRTELRETQAQDGVFSKIEFTDGLGHKLINLEEDSVPGQFVATKATRYGLRGTVLYTFQPYGKADDSFALPSLSLPRSDLFHDAQGRVIRTVLPPESGSPTSSRRETRAHFLPLTVFSFDEEDMSSTDPSRPHLNTPKVRYMDGLGRLIGVDEILKDKGNGAVPRDAESWPTRYSYDLNNNLVRILDSQGNQKWMRYDGLGRMLFMNDLDRGAIRYIYDDASNRVETVDAAGQRTTLTYDGVNRLLTEDYHDNGKPFSFGREYDPSQPITETNRPDIIFTYDKAAGPVTVNDSNHILSNIRGRLAHVDDLSGEVSFSYDERGRESSSVKLIRINGESQTSSYINHLDYDALDRVNRITYPDGDAVTYQYNARSLIAKILIRSAILSNATDVIKEIKYLPSGQLSSCEYGNHVLTTYDYDPRLRLTSLATTASGQEAAPLLSYQYNYDGVSNVTRIDDKRSQVSDDRRNTQLFTYDDLNRLTRVQYSMAAAGGASIGTHIDYSYDRIGNLVTQQSDINHLEDGQSVTNLGDLNYGDAPGTSRRIGRTTADAGPHALTVAGGQVVSYDANGNVTRIGSTTLTWDFLNRLVASDSRVARSEYVYDFTGRRVIKRVWTKQAGGTQSSPTLMQYVSKYYEVSEDTRSSKYVFNGPSRLARVDGTQVTYFHLDHIQSTTMTTDAAGTVKEEYAYYPYGRMRYQGGAPANDVRAAKFRFTGKEHDEETSLEYFEARYLMSSVGRFISVDPAETSTEQLLNPQGLNQYSYCLNSPLSLVDPDGKEPVRNQIGSATDVGRLLSQPNLSQLLPDWSTANTNPFRGVPARGGPGAPIRYVPAESISGHFIDMQHFVAAAAGARKIGFGPIGYEAAVHGGLLIEVEQLWIGLFKPDKGLLKSAFSYEDMPSNEAGARFGAYRYDPGKSLGPQVESFLKNELKALSLDQFKSKFTDQFNNLPQTEKGAGLDSYKQTIFDATNPGPKR